jgi:DNA repair exonuclease SbcCD ATPase subunit
MNTRLFGQKVKDFFTDLIDSEKKDIFRKILSFQKWEARYDLVRDALKDIKNLIADKNSEIKVTEGRIEEIENQLTRERIRETTFYQEQTKLIETLEDEISDEKESLKLREESLKNLLAQEKILTKLVDDLKNIENTFNELSQKAKQALDSLAVHRDKKESELKAAASAKEREEYEKFSKEKSKFLDMINSIQREILTQKNVAEGKQGKIESEASYLHGQVLSLNNMKEELTKVLNSDVKTCPTCKRDIDDDAISHLQEKIQACDSEIQNLTEQMKQKEHMVSGIREKLKEVLKQLDSEKRHQESQLAHAEESYNQMINVYKQRLETALTQVADIATKTEQDIKAKYQAEKEELEKSYNEFLAQKEELTKLKDDINTKTLYKISQALLFQLDI